MDQISSDKWRAKTPVQALEVLSKIEKLIENCQQQVKTLQELHQSFLLEYSGEEAKKKYRNLRAQESYGETFFKRSGKFLKELYGKLEEKGKCAQQP